MAAMRQFSSHHHIYIALLLVVFFIFPAQCDSRLLDLLRHTDHLKSITFFCLCLESYFVVSLLPVLRIRT